MDESGFSHINMIPMIDIMLVLLTIVLSTSTLIASGAIPLQLPQASTQPKESLRPQTIEIDASGMIYYRGAHVGLPVLREKLERVDRSQPVLIRADKELRLQAFVDVLDVVHGMHFSQVSLETSYQ